MYAFVGGHQTVSRGVFRLIYNLSSMTFRVDTLALDYPSHTLPMITGTLYHHHMLFVRLIFLLPNHVSLPLSTFMFWLDYKLLASFFLCCSILLLEHA
jgi:hypothetical protein